MVKALLALGMLQFVIFRISFMSWLSYFAGAEANVTDNAGRLPKDIEKYFPANPALVSVDDATRRVSLSAISRNPAVIKQSASVAGRLWTTC